MFVDGTIPKLLDIIDVPLLNPDPRNHQTENHLIAGDASRSWQKVDELPWAALEQLRNSPISLWINSDHTARGVFDCIHPTEAATLSNSLTLIKVKDFNVKVSFKVWEGRTTKTYRGNFNHNGIYYSLSLTDPVATHAFSEKVEGAYPLNDVYLCVSLTEPYERDGRCHKLVAAIIKNPPL